MSAATSGASAAALAAANQAADEACARMIQTYRNDSTDVRSMQTYSECVARLYPTVDDTGDLIVAIMFLVAMIVGGVIGVLQRNASTEDRVLGGLVGLALGGACAALFMVGAVIVSRVFG